VTDFRKNRFVYYVTDFLNLTDIMNTTDQTNELAQIRGEIQATFSALMKLSKRIDAIERSRQRDLVELKRAIKASWKQAR